VSDKTAAYETTVGALRRALDGVLDEVPVLVHAEDATGHEVFAAMDDAGLDGSCEGVPVFRIWATQQESVRDA
jgi:hypothetical protein